MNDRILQGWAKPGDLDRIVFLCIIPESFALLTSGVIKEPEALPDRWYYYQEFQGDQGDFCFAIVKGPCSGRA